MNDPLNKIHSVLTDIVKELVDNDKAVEINIVKGSTIYIFEVNVDKRDVGKVIGKQGKTAFAIRTLLTAIGAKYKLECRFEIIE